MTIPHRHHRKKRRFRIIYTDSSEDDDDEVVIIEKSPCPSSSKHAGDKVIDEFNTCMVHDRQLGERRSSEVE